MNYTSRIRNYAENLKQSVSRGLHTGKSIPLSALLFWVVLA